MATTAHPDALANSLSSLSSSSSHPPSISKTYKQSSQLFLTRQFAEAWDVLSPLVTAGTSDAKRGDQTQHGHQPHAPVLSANKNARVKVWSLWIAIIHETLQLGPEEGGAVLENVYSPDGKNGSRRWRELSKKVKDGDIWEEVTKTGYAGIEAAVDAEVVANLATLLLSHAPLQKVTQARLETYLSASSSMPQPDQLFSQLERAQNDPAEFGSPLQQVLSNGAQNGTSTPRDLGTRLKLLEIYALHVLPRNEEWEYAREFINMSEVLDEERRDAFLSALGSLREESDLQSRREVELQRQRDEEEQRRKKAELDQQRQEEEKRYQRSLDSREGKGPTSAQPTANGGPKTSAPSKPTANGAVPSSRPGRSQHAPAPSKSSIKRTPSSGAAAKRTANARPPTFLGRASLTIAALQRGIVQMGQSLSRNPMALLRMLFFIIAMVMALGRRDVRDRLSKVWEKVKGTAGMGVKVSYL